MQNDEIRTQFAKFLREKRTALGMSLRTFSIHIYGFESNFSYLGELERGSKKPTLATMEQILDKLNCKFHIEEL
jgi:transcriptional regulator with XRE-family HTH domain